MPPRTFFSLTCFLIVRCSNWAFLTKTFRKWNSLKYFLRNIPNINIPNTANKRLKKKLNPMLVMSSLMEKYRLHLAPTFGINVSFGREDYGGNPMFYMLFVSASDSLPIKCFFCCPISSPAESWMSGILAKKTGNCSHPPGWNWLGKVFRLLVIIAIQCVQNE